MLHKALMHVARRKGSDLRAGDPLPFWQND
jgi:hypothetical protein